MVLREVAMETLETLASNSAHDDDGNPGTYFCIDWINAMHEVLVHLSIKCKDITILLEVGALQLGMFMLKRQISSCTKGSSGSDVKLGMAIVMELTTHRAIFIVVCPPLKHVRVE